MNAFRIRADEVRKAADAAGHTTLRSISEHTGIHRTSLSALMNGRTTPGLTTAMRIYRVYQMPLDKIVEEITDDELLSAGAAKDAA